MADTEGYVPTLGEYAAVIDWLWTERHTFPQKHPNGVHMADIPIELHKPFNDALQRASLRRTSQRMAADLDENGQPIEQEGRDDRQ